MKALWRSSSGILTLSRFWPLQIANTRGGESDSAARTTINAQHAALRLFWLLVYVHPENPHLKMNAVQCDLAGLPSRA